MNTSIFFSACLGSYFQLISKHLFWHSIQQSWQGEIRKAEEYLRRLQIASYRSVLSTWLLHHSLQCFWKSLYTLAQGLARTQKQAWFSCLLPQSTLSQDFPNCSQDRWHYSSQQSGSQPGLYNRPEKFKWPHLIFNHVEESSTYNISCALVFFQCKLVSQYYRIGVENEEGARKCTN